MRYPLLLLAAAAALSACGQSPANNLAAGNGSAVAVPDANAAATSGNSLWGTSEAEDEASHRGIDFIAFNRTGQTVIRLSIRPDEGPLDPGAPETPWSANVLAQRELPDGQRAAAHYEADIELCRWQVRATFAGGQTRDYPAVNLCESIRVDLR
jgi:hypothetical protein